MKALAIPPQSAWTEVDWAQRIRCFSEAMGVTSRRTLLQRARTSPGPVEDVARQVLHDLLDLTDLAGGPQATQVAPAPWRKVCLEDWWVSLGGPARQETSSAPLTFARIYPASWESPSVPQVSLDLWLDPYREALESSWFERALPRQLGILTEPCHDSIQVYDPGRAASHQEGRWRSPRHKEDGPALVRWRGSNGRPQHHWGEWEAGKLLSARLIPSDIACQARFLLDHLEKNPILGRAEPGKEVWSFWCPSWLPRAEYRLLLATSLRRPRSLRDPWLIPSWLAGPVLRLLKQRLHLDWEGPEP